MKLRAPRQSEGRQGSVTGVVLYGMRLSRWVDGEADSGETPGEKLRMCLMQRRGWGAYCLPGWRDLQRGAGMLARGTRGERRGPWCPPRQRISTVALSSSEDDGVPLAAWGFQHVGDWGMRMNPGHWPAVHLRGPCSTSRCTCASLPYVVQASWLWCSMGHGAGALRGAYSSERAAHSAVEAVVKSSSSSSSPAASGWHGGVLFCRLVRAAASSSAATAPSQRPVPCNSVLS